MSENISAIRKSYSLLPLVLVLPFILGAGLYLSVIFAIFAALPITYALIRFGRIGGVLCGVINLAIIWLVSGQLNAAVFFVTAVVLGTALAESIRLRLKPQAAIFLCVGMMAISTALLLASYSTKYHINPIDRVEALISSAVDKVVLDIERYKATNQTTSQDLERILADPQMTKKNIFNELSSFVGITFLLICVANFLTLMRLNPLKVRESVGLKKDFFRAWKSPDHLVWPTLLAGFCLVVEIPYLTPVALNLFKILMAMYAVQGVAILGALFDSWKLRHSFRPLAYLCALAVLLPLVISLGFFDLWFDFRNKFKIKT